MILEKPIITTRVSGVEELFLNNKYGLITDNDEEDLYINLKRMLTDKNLYNKYLNCINERASFFDINKLIFEVEKIL